MIFPEASIPYVGRAVFHRDACGLACGQPTHATNVDNADFREVRNNSRQNLFDLRVHFFDVGRSKLTRQVKPGLATLQDALECDHL